MKIWIDIDNSPHVLFFRPIIMELKKRGHEVVITAHDHAQTIGLLKLHNIDHVTIGKHTAKHDNYRRILKMLMRIIRLVIIGHDIRPDVSLSHGSRSLAVAAWLLGIPHYVSFDYEYINKKVFFLLSQRIIVPECIGRKVLSAEKFPMTKTISYPGIKEDISLLDFRPDSDLPAVLKTKEFILAFARPPASTAHYFCENSMFLFNKLIEYLLNNGVKVILSARNLEQMRMFLRHDSIIVLERVYDGPTMIYYSDMVVGGGGSMNREAALLGTPCYSVFSSKRGSVDLMLERGGNLVFINAVEDFKKIKIQKRDRGHELKINNEALDFLINVIETKSPDGLRAHCKPVRTQNIRERRFNGG